MLIQATSYTKNIAYEERLVQKYGKDTPAFQQAAAVVDKVTISDAGRMMNEAVSHAVDPNKNLWARPTTDGSFPKAVMLTNYADAKQHAEAGLKEALTQLGIPSNTRISITFNPDGTIAVDGGGDKNAELETLINENRDLNNILRAAASTAHMERSLAASEQARMAVEANPGRYEQAYRWAIGVTQSIESMGFQFDFSDGALIGSFLSNGHKIGLRENMEQLLASSRASLGS